MFDFGKVGREGVGKERRKYFSFPSPPPPSSRLSTAPLLEISHSPQPSSDLRIQDGGHTFREEVRNVRSLKLPLHCRLCPDWSK